MYKVQCSMKTHEIETLACETLNRMSRGSCTLNLFPLLLRSAINGVVIALNCFRPFGGRFRLAGVMHALAGIGRSSTHFHTSALGTQAEVAERFVQGVLGFGGLGARLLGSRHALLPIVDESLRVVLAPAQVFEQRRFVVFHFVLQMRQGQVHLLLGIFQVGVGRAGVFQRR